MQNWYKNALFDASVLFELPYMQICRTVVTRDAPEQTYRLLKPIDIKLDMCDANVQKHQFSNLPAY